MYNLPIKIKAKAGSSAKWVSLLRLLNAFFSVHAHIPTAITDKPNICNRSHVNIKTYTIKIMKVLIVNLTQNNTLKLNMIYFKQQLTSLTSSRRYFC